MQPLDMAFVERQFRRLAAVVLVGFLAGCTTAMQQSISNTLGRIPIVSLVIDGSQLGDMAKRFDEGSISEAEIKAIESRDLPSPPGISHDLAALRRAMAALLAGNLQGAAVAAVLVVRHSEHEELKIIALGIAAEVEQARGRLQTAMRHSADAERRWISLARAARAKNRPVPKYEFGRHIGVARVAGHFDEAERLLRAYASWRAHFPKTTLLADLTSDADFAREKGEYLLTIGNYDNAYSTAATGLDAFRARVSAQKSLSVVEELSARAMRESMLRLLIRICISQAQFAKAAQHLEELRALVDANGNRRLSVAALHHAAAYLMASAGEYKQAVAKFDEGWRMFPAAVQNSKIATLQMSSVKGMALALGDDLQGAYATLAQVGATGGTEDSILRDVHRAVLVAVSAMLGRFDPSPESLNARDGRYRAHLASEHGVVHFGAKVLAYERRGAHRRSMADHVLAVQNGRDFSRGLRAMQLSGEMRALPLMDRFLSLVKESYVAAASTALGQGGVTSEDLLDALTLLQRTETDDDIAAAATRQRSIPGVSAAQLRELQDLRQTARTAQRQLMAYGSSFEADPQRATQLGKAALDAGEQLLAFVRRLRQRAPGLYNVLGPDVLTLVQLQAQLEPREALASISVLRDQTHILLLTRSGVHQRLLPLPPHEARDLVARIRDTVALDANTATPTLEFDFAAAHSLHKRLFGWAADPMRNVEHLTVVSAGALASIPFGLLIQHVPATDQTGGSHASQAWLIKSMAVSHMPSLAAWSAIAGRTWGANGTTFVAWADPTFVRSEAAAAGLSERGLRAPSRRPSGSSGTDAARLPHDLGTQLLRLVDTRQEAEAIAVALGASPRDDVIVGDLATRSSVLAMSKSGALKRKSVVMFATHGLMPAQIPGLSQPALALAQEPGESLPSLLGLDDVVSLELDADWVLLSACNTSSADRADGDALSGLARGFFFAGARSILVTHWAVESKSAAAITTKAIEHMMRDRSINRAQALQRTAVDMIESRYTPSKWSHPAYWAPYALVGGRTR